MDPSQERKACLKLAQLYGALQKRCHTNVIEKVLDKEGDINYALQGEGPFKISRLNYTGYTALHFACLIKNTVLVNKLLDHGADFTKKTKGGKTALHLSLEHDKNFSQVFDCLAVRKIEEENKNFTQPLDNLLVNSVLTAHVTRNNFSNPCDENGLSHFHIACRTNNSGIVQLFLANGVSVDECTSINSKYSPGYTPLHFAAMCLNTKVIEVLLAYGANIHIADANGKTPLHMLVERKIEMFNSIDHYPWRKDDHSELRELIKENDKIINMLLENTSTDNDCLDHIGLSNFHVACTLEDTSIAERLADQCTNINHGVNKDSRLWPGYTALHFAAKFSLSTVEMLVKKGADMGSKDATGLTPLDICIKRYKIEDICKIISLNANWKRISFSDSKTKLVSLISSLADTNSFKSIIRSSIKNINIRIPIKSALWAGYTPLHLAVLFSERPRLIFGEYKNTEKETSFQIIRFCLSQGADLRVQDSRGQTALHLAFRLGKTNVVDLMFRQCREIPNVTDDENLSHLHIACAARLKTPKLYKCVPKAGEVNAVYKGTSPVNGVRPGWAPLHVSLVNCDFGVDFRNAVSTLLRYGADPNAKDVDGLTPIHWTLEHAAYKSVASKLLKQVSTDSVAELHNVSYLHVACQIGNVAAARGLLKNGADVNLAIAYADPENVDEPLSFLSRYDQCTPLHCSSDTPVDMEKLLLQRGADVFAKKADGSTALDRTSVLTHFINKLWKDVELQNRVRREFGWTKLHLACRLPSVFGNEIRSIVEAQPTDINARVSSNSPLWKGYTPLHLLIHFSQSVKCYSDDEETTYPLLKTLLEILLDKGADVTALNDEKNSPIGMLFQNFARHKYMELVALMMKFHREFDVNPVNAQGVSHFHVACYLNDVDAVEAFLLHGVDVNRPIDYFSGFLPGHTPLHLASKLPVVDLLISHGADVHIEDVHGFNALQEAVKRYPFDESVVTKIIESGSAINSPNFRGMTPFEIATAHGMTINKLLFFMRQGSIVNTCNPITGVGYISLVLRGLDRHDQETTSIVEMMMSQSSTNVLGRTTLHHLVTSKWSNPSFIVFIEKLLKSGHDIDEQDRDGKTALHLAVEFHNDVGVRVLLMSGADINVLDLNGSSVLSSAFDRSTPQIPDSLSVKSHLIIYAYRMVLLKLDLNQLDFDRLSGINYLHHTITHREFLQDVDRSKEIKVGVRDMRLHDFLSETNAVLIYSSLNQLERQRIDQFFETINNDSRVKEIRNLLKLQYRKAVKRLEYYGPATSSMRSLLGFDLPDLCAENIFLYLPTLSLKDLILAGVETKNMGMDVN